MGLPLNHAFFVGICHEKKKPSSYWGTSFIEPLISGFDYGLLQDLAMTFLGNLAM
jgi:hypothetical protein